MKKIFIRLIALFVLLSVFDLASAKDKIVITLEQLNKMFVSMRSDLGDKVDGDLLWGYFFTDSDPKKLQPLADRLSKNGYRVVNIYLTDDKNKYFLHIEKIEHHTPESLNKRNAEFYKLANEFQLESYDGMDVGPVGK
ncbi:ribonuclease E inhibitor RraB [Solimicrobium silvestre]|uniref:Regulator of ribonuclease activity B domain-containing protein n=1 Tax=Solimicrobium silvestre TaxID=2099400 RepID=A0A2S9GW67_9BURK|nr:ribonuclease E inhibitor RraB [Solimicrobium silvestre]PRC91938.1 hypothetical protein S2091_3280 [Solimicrobium silvestre]